VKCSLSAHLRLGRDALFEIKLAGTTRLTQPKDRVT
jgi:hypothetical protein